MAIVLIVAGQWLFAMMIGSGMLGMAIPLISRVMRDRASRRTEAARTETDPPTQQRDRRQCPGQPTPGGAAQSRRR